MRVPFVFLLSLEVTHELNLRSYIPSLDSTLMGPLSIDGLAVHKESISIDIAIAVERHMNGDVESPLEYQIERDQDRHEVTVEI